MNTVLRKLTKPEGGAEFVAGTRSKRERELLAACASSSKKLRCTFCISIGRLKMGACCSQAKPEGAGDAIGSLHFKGTGCCEESPPYTFAPGGCCDPGRAPTGMPAQCCLPNAGGGMYSRELSLHSFSRFLVGIPVVLSVDTLVHKLSHVV